MTNEAAKHARFYLMCAIDEMISARTWLRDLDPKLATEAQQVLDNLERMRSDVARSPSTDDALSRFVIRAPKPAGDFCPDCAGSMRVVTMLGKKVLKCQNAATCGHIHGCT